MFSYDEAHICCIDMKVVNEYESVGVEQKCKEIKNLT